MQEVGLFGSLSQKQDQIFLLAISLTYLVITTQFPVAINYLLHSFGFDSSEG